MKTNPTEKTKYLVDITRYSFKVNFGKYVDGQTYYGLDKLNLISLNNVHADATYMKDYLSDSIFSEVGVESPLVSYVHIQINGEDFGLYLAIEDISDAYLERTAEGDGELYKPETAQLANMVQAGGGMEMPDGAQMPEGMEKPDYDVL